MSNNIIDLHCDLLSFLANHANASVFDPRSRCSIPFMKEGRVSIQVCAVFTETQPGSHASFLRQVNCFKEIIKSGLCEEFCEKKSDKIQLILAVENASGLCEENEPIFLLEKRLKHLASRNQVLYVGPVWNSGNRFAGGIDSTNGLTKDGKLLLELLNNLKIAVDISHCNDRSADDILDYINNKLPELIPVASHSNSRVIENQARNLLDVHAAEIVKRKGLIGINFVHRFIGNNFEESLIKHVEHFLSEVEAQDSLCFGADFFFSEPKERKFHHNYSNSSCYVNIYKALAGNISKDQLYKITENNANVFLLNFLLQ